MFKFDFKIEEENDNPFLKDNKAAEDEKETCGKLEEYESEEVVPTKDIADSLDVYKLNSTSTTIGDKILEHIVPGYLLQDITTHDIETTKDISKAEQSHSDLLPGVYEGGAKIWECTDDLLNYLADNYADDKLLNKQVLDLGCGSGLLGLYAYKCGAKVHFQDYNKDVLERITIPNVLLNVMDDEAAVDLSKVSQNCKFYSGDWCKYAKATEDKFDFVLTSETIYNPANQRKLLDTLYAKLKPNGVVLLAAKTYYFGVGGGLRQFETIISKDKTFSSKVVWTSVEGVGREILELKHL